MQKEDLTCKVFGHLTVLKKSDKRGNGVFYVCFCANCGNTKDIQATKLRSGWSTTCGCSKVTPDLSGQAFGRLSVINRADNKGGQVQWNCLCQCGGSITVSGANLRSGNTASCGCLRREVSVELGKSTKRHGMESTPTYRSWTSMKVRCSDKNHISFKNYGGRGITVCDSWLIFDNFLADMGVRPDGTTLDRKDTNGNYEPSNCRWASAVVQHRNTRLNKFFEFNGENITLAEISERYGVNISTLRARVRARWSIEDAVNKPLRHVQNKALA